jgi:hypothetical protein
MARGSAAPAEPVAAPPKRARAKLHGGEPTSKLYLLMSEEQRAEVEKAARFCGVPASTKARELLLRWAHEANGGRVA